MVPSALSPDPIMSGWVAITTSAGAVGYGGRAIGVTPRIEVMRMSGPIGSGMATAIDSTKAAGTDHNRARVSLARSRRDESDLNSN